MISSCLRALLRPAVSFCLRHNVPVQDLIEIAKDLMVKLGTEDLGSSTSKITVSRLSLLTGIRRREVQRLMKGQCSAIVKDVSSASVLTRVVNRWGNDPRFCLERGHPKPLTLHGRNSEYNKLIKSVTSDVSPGTVLLELLRTGAVQLNNGLVTFVKTIHHPDGNVLEGYKLLATDVNDLGMAVEENLFAQSLTPNHHATTEFHNIVESKVDSVRRWIAREGAAFHQRARDFLAKCDKDLNPELKGKAGVRVVIGSFSRVIGATNIEHNSDAANPELKNSTPEKPTQTYFG